MDTSRRRFIQSAALGMLVAGCSRGANNAPAANAAHKLVLPAPTRLDRVGVLVGGGKAADESGNIRFFVGVNDLDAAAPSARPIPEIGFLGHGFTPRIDKPHIVLVTEKHGQGCIELDLKSGKILRRIKAGKGREFYGHSAFSPDGKLWYSTEANTADRSYDGVLAVRDADSMELLDKTFPTHGVSPHDCILIEDGATLVITNGGGPISSEDEPASVAYVDVKTGEARKLLKFKHKRVNAGHISMTSRGELVCVSAPRDGIADTSADWRGAISFYHPEGDRFVTAEDPVCERMKGETLSVAIREETMIVGATNPSGDLVTFWDFKTGKLVKVIENLKWPRGISLSLDGRWFVVTHDQATHVTLIDAESLVPKPALTVETSYIAGSHNYLFDL